MEDKKDIFDYIKHQPIKTPDKAYFENLANKVIEEQQPGKVIKLYRRPIVWMSAAAAVIAVIVFMNLGNTSIEEDALLALNDVPTEDVMAYIDANLEEFDTDLIVDAIDEANIEDVQLIEESTPVESDINLEEIIELNFEDINTDDILDYLQNEELDISDLEDDELFI